MATAPGAGPNGGRTKLKQRIEIPDTHLYSEVKDGRMRNDFTLRKTRKFGMDFREGPFVPSLFLLDVFPTLNHYF